MSYIKTIAADQASGAVHDMYQHQEEHWGYVPNYAKSFSHRPEVLARWGRLLAEIRRPLDDRRFELATFAAAAYLKHTACSLAHGGILADMIGTDEAVAIAEGREAEVLPAVDTAIVRFARDIARDAGEVSAAQVDELRSEYGLDEGEIFDIAAAAAARCFFTKILDAVGSKPDDPLLAANSELTKGLLR